MLTTAGGAALVFAVGVQAYRANVREAQLKLSAAALRQAQVAVALNTALHAADLVVQLKGGSNRAIRSADVLWQSEEPGAPASWTVIAGSADGLLFRQRFTRAERPVVVGRAGAGDLAAGGSCIDARRRRGRRRCCGS